MAKWMSKSEVTAFEGMRGYRLSHFRQRSNHDNSSGDVDIVDSKTGSKLGVWPPAGPRHCNLFQFSICGNGNY